MMEGRVSAALTYHYFIICSSRVNGNSQSVERIVLLSVLDFSLSHVALIRSQGTPFVFTLSSFPSLICFGLDLSPCHT